MINILLVLLLAGVAMVAGSATDNEILPCVADFNEVIVLDPQTGEAGVLTTGDVDDDGFQDIVFCKTGVCTVHFGAADLEEVEDENVGLEDLQVDEDVNGNIVQVNKNFVPTVVRVGDVDNDGDLDIVVGGEQGIQVIRNENNERDELEGGKFVTDTERDNLVGEFLAIVSLEVGDMNDDNFVDIVYTLLEEESIELMLNIGVEVANVNQQFINSFDQLIIIAAARVPNPDFNDTLDESDDNVRNLVEPDLVRPAAPALRDLDNDGTLDIVTGSQDFLTWFQNLKEDEEENPIDPGTQFLRRDIAATAALAISNVIVAAAEVTRTDKFNIDTYFMFQNALNGEGNGALKSYTNEDWTNNGFQTTNFLDQDIEDPLRFILKDLNKDTLPDAVYGQFVEGAPISVLLNANDVDNPSQNTVFDAMPTELANDDSILIDIAVADFDGDGDEDIILTRLRIERVEIEIENEEEEEEEEEVVNNNSTDNSTDDNSTVVEEPEPEVEVMETFFNELVVIVNDCEDLTLAPTVFVDNDLNEDDEFIIGLLAVLIVMCCCIIVVLLCFIGVIIRGGTLPLYGPVGNQASYGRQGSRRGMHRHNSRKL